MEREVRRTRRSMIGAAGGGVAALLAGCTGPEDEEDADLPAEEETGNGQTQDDESEEENESEE